MVSPSSSGIISDFRQRLLAHIQAFRQYPAQAQAERLQGRIDLAFVMTRSGAVLDIRILAGSGHLVLDQAAVDTILRAQPLPVVPLDMDTPLRVEIPVEFFLPR